MPAPQVSTAVLLTLLLANAGGLSAAPVGGRGIASLRAGFAEPTAASGPYTWWHWMNGNVSREGITSDLEAMRAVGVRGAYLFDIGGEGERGQVPPGPVRVLSSDWFDHVQHAADEAERLGLELLAHNCAGWSTTGDPAVSVEDSMKRLVWSETRLTGGEPISITLAKPTHGHGYYRDLAVLALPGKNPTRVVDHEAKSGWEQRAAMMVATPGSKRVAGVPMAEVITLPALPEDGVVAWDAPAGDWTVVRLGCTTTGRTNHPAQPEGRGFEVDKMDRAAVGRFFRNGLPGRLASMRTAGGEPAFKALLIDSHEAGMQNWTPRLIEEFRRRRGYSPTPYLAALAGFVVEDAETTDRFLWDYRRTLADLMTDCHAGELRRLMNEAGLEMHLEPYAQGNYRQAEYGAAADVVMTEFWKGRRRDGRVKPVASIAHSLGSSEVRAEAFTTSYWNSGWRGHPWELKSAGETAWANGVTRCVFHTWAHQALPESIRPGMTMGPWGVGFNQRQTWWELAPAWLAYIQRSQALLQSGHSTADVAVLLDESAPRPEANGLGTLTADLPEGFDYDLVGPGLLQEGATGGPDGLRLASGARYALLKLPRAERITPELMRAIDRLARAGTPMLGWSYTAAPGLADAASADAEVQRLSEALARDARRGELPTYYLGVTLGEALQALGLPPDLEATCSPAGVRLAWIHRRTQDADLYFVANPEPKRVRAKLRFRSRSRAPEVWDPVTGETRRLGAYSVDDGAVAFDLTLAPWQSVFVVLPDGEAPRPRWSGLVGTASAAAAVEPRIEVLRARLGSTTSRGGSVDATEAVQREADSGRLERVWTGDQLALQYRLGGETHYRWLTYGDRLLVEAGGPPAAAVTAEFAADGGSLLVCGPGPYRVLSHTGPGPVVAPEPKAFRQRLTRPWRVRFLDGPAAPAEIGLAELSNLSEHPDPQVRYYSGRIEYRTRFDLPVGWTRERARIELAFGRIANLAQVACNGTEVGTLWARPYRCDLTPLVTEGENELRIEVANSWSNRLIGDEQHPSDVPSHPSGVLRGPLPDWVLNGEPDARVETRRQAFSTYRHYGAEDRLPPSGLIGPAELVGWVEIPLPPAAPETGG